MKKRFLVYFTLLLAAISFIYPSCKKVIHETNPTPGNYRLLSYSKITTKSIIYPPTLTPVVTENFRFIYDATNKVQQMFITSNDSNKVKIGMGNLSITFTYVMDTIYKTSTDLNTRTVVERDTFIQNSFGQIKEALFPSLVYKYEYFGKLLAKETTMTRDTNTTITANATYTSNNGDFLNRLFDGMLTVNFPDSGIRPFITPLDTFRDTLFIQPIDITWNKYHNNGTVTTTNNNGVNSYTNVLTNGYQDPVTVDAVDANGVRVRTGYFPGGSADKQFFQIYDYLTNRTGDYLQLQSFTTYGLNIYQNTHMVKSITTPYSITTAAYTIDADSKVNIMNVTIKDSLVKNVISEAYKLQYETY